MDSTPLDPDPQKPAWWEDAPQASTPQGGAPGWWSDAPAPPVEKPWYQKAADWALSPIEAVAQAAKRGGESLISAGRENQSPLSAWMRNFGAGALEGAASLTSPANLAATAATGGELAGVGELGTGASALLRVLQGASGVPVAVRGAQDIKNGSPMRGAAELALGGLGVAGALRGRVPTPEMSPEPYVGTEAQLADTSPFRPVSLEDLPEEFPTARPSTEATARIRAELQGARAPWWEETAPSGETETSQAPVEAAQAPVDLPQAPAQVKPRIPPAVTALWQDLQPKWQAALDAQQGDDIPFTVDPREDLLPFAKRVMTDNPRELMGAERKVQAGLSPGDLSAARPGEAGYVDLSAFPSRDELADTLTSKVAPALDKWNYFSMLSGPPTLAKKLLGDTGQIGVAAARTALGGDPAQAVNILRKFFSTETLRDTADIVKRNYSSSGASGASDYGRDVSGVLGTPSSVMGATDSAAINALQRAGFSADEATQMLPGTRTPVSKLGSALANLPNRAGPIGRLAIPFAKTAVNLGEMGIEHTPVLGNLAEWATNGKMSTSLAKQALGAGAGIAAYEDPKDVGNRYVQAAMGPLALPSVIGSSLGTAYGKPGATSHDAAMQVIGDLLKLSPASVDAYDLDPARILARLVPNAFATPPVAGTGVEGLPVDPAFLKTSPHSWIDPAIAKIPYLNSALLPTKRPERPWWE